MDNSLPAGMSSEDASYLKKHHLETYVNDAVEQLLNYKESNSNVNIAKFFHEYFKVALNGRHIIFRNYPFVSATAHNRICFIDMVNKCFHNFHQQNLLVSSRECVNLVQLLCHDFKEDVVKEAFETASAFEKSTESVHFPAFLLALQFHFCCEDFVNELGKILLNADKEPREAIAKFLAEMDASEYPVDALRQSLNKTELTTKCSLCCSAAFSADLNSFYGKIK